MRLPPQSRAVEPAQRKQVQLCERRFSQRIEDKVIADLHFLSKSCVLDFQHSDSFRFLSKRFILVPIQLNVLTSRSMNTVQNSKLPSLKVYNIKFKNLLNKHLSIP